MYTIKNTSSKIIHINGTILMPDQTMKVSEKTAKLPSIQAFAKRKMLEVTAPVVEAPKQDANPGEKADGEKAGEGEDTAGEAGEDKAPEAPKGARRTTKKPESKE